MLCSKTTEQTQKFQHPTEALNEDYLSLLLKACIGTCGRALIGLLALWPGGLLGLPQGEARYR